MRPIYLDLHIHTSDDPAKLNPNYDLDQLILKLNHAAKSSDYLISFTDHNTINKKAYLDVYTKIPNNIIVGVELHISSHETEESNAYHCHIYFNFDNDGIKEEVLNDLNSRLDKLYPDKKPQLKDKTIPGIQDIIEIFDDFDFILLPHGGQTHATFDAALPKGKIFDNAMQRSIYYNFFDGFTSRSNQGTEKTRQYLEKLGVQEFVNLVTCTDNYDPKDYPNPKSSEALKFIPTWMLAAPTFAGLRLSLSDNSRLIYSYDKPKEWRESIKSIKHSNENIEIDVNLTPGLNVVIGESSSGKTLFVDSIAKKIMESDFKDSAYQSYDISNIKVNYPEGLHPHYINQNYITTVTIGDRKINEIPIISKILPENTNARKAIDLGKKDINNCLDTIFIAEERIEDLESEIERIPILSALIDASKVEENVLRKLQSISTTFKDVEYESTQEQEDTNFLYDLEERLGNNPFIKHNKKLIPKLIQEITEMGAYSKIDNQIRNSIKIKKAELDFKLEGKEGESRQKKTRFDNLIIKLKEYQKQLIIFDTKLEVIAGFSVKSMSEKVELEGYKLSIENKFRLDKQIVLEELNKLLLKENEISQFTEITPDRLFRKKFRNNLKGSTIRSDTLSYKTIRENLHANIIGNDTIHYKIYTPENEDFDTLSPGKKTAIILHLILNFDGDYAPLIIDQPEDNLATSYMNDGLVRAIKKMKDRKQIIFVSHNATIPMAGDAQNIILCRNDGNKIEIKSNPLEGSIDGVDMVDYIARIADGGKASIKKRFKKYNLKKFKD